MPILVKDYTWRQSDSLVVVQVPLKGINAAHVDIFSSHTYLKAHFQPFLFEVYLWDEVDIERSKCVVQEKEVYFELLKKDICLWENLEKDISKEEKILIKQKVLEEAQAKAAENFEKKVTRKNELDRYSVRQAMDIDNKQHVIINARRNRQCEVAMKELEEWRLNKKKTLESESKDVAHLKDNPKIAEIIENDGIESAEDKSKYLQKVEESSHTLKAKESIIHIKKPPVQHKIRSEFVDKKKKELAIRKLPGLRQSSTMEISFTARVFPTPSRESKEEEEQIWLKNITEARRATGFISEDLRPEEQDPQWCKDKGDEFYRSGNFLGAISAYSHGIQLSDKLPSLYANRAATHFMLGNFNKCLGDTSKALELMKPECEGNRQSRARCIARRAAALARLGLLNKAIDEMKAASRLLPNDEKIKRDIYDMERAWEQNPDSD